MLVHLQFQISPKDLKKAKAFLEPLSSEPLYIIKEETCIQIGGFFNHTLSDLPVFLSSYTQLDSHVDWSKQWQDFSPHIKNDKLELDLSCYGCKKIIYLKPGPGFGDLSHPTTKLCLKHLAKVDKNLDVIDFGCGSGVLSVAAYAFGAQRVISLEIEPDAISHAKNNLKLNGFRDDLVLSCMPALTLNHPLCVINMTFGEQKIAFFQLSMFPKNTTFLSSGILQEQKNAYLEWAKSKNLELEMIDKEGKWLLFKGQLRA